MIPADQGLLSILQISLAAAAVGLALGLVPQYRRPPVKAWAASWVALLVYVAATNVPTGQGAAIESHVVVRVAPDLRVLLMSGYSPELVTANQPGSSDIPHFLSKPFTTNQLLVAVRDALDHREELATLPSSGRGE